MTEPIAFYDPHKGFYWAKPTKITAPVVVDVEPLALYTQRTWVGLTDEEIEVIEALKAPPVHPDFVDCDDWMEFAKAIEAKLKEKNT